MLEYRNGRVERVPLRLKDCHLTTFITRGGFTATCVTPRDSWRFHAILEDFRDKERCVDDTIF